MTMRRKEILVSGSANAQSLSTAIVSTEQEKIRIKRIFITEVTGTLQKDAVIEIWWEQLRVCQISIRHLLYDYANSLFKQDGFVDIDLPLPVGNTLYVGHVSGGTASNIRFNIEYTVNE